MNTTRFNDILAAFSIALDQVEHEMLGVSDHHAKRVAYITAKMCQTAHLSQDLQIDAAACALLHDNALTESQSTLRGDKDWQSKWPGIPETGLHCAMGARNMANLPTTSDIRGFIRFHHENADGSGPFGLTTDATPLPARMIHLADQLDRTLNLGMWTPDKAAVITAYLDQNRGNVFDAATLELFQDALSVNDLAALSSPTIDAMVAGLIPTRDIAYSGSELAHIATLFARITDYKSSFTCSHSMGIANKARRMAAFYHYDPEVAERYYVAGALHDVGKLMIPNRILEKPGPLTKDEYTIMKKHASYSFKVLNPIKGFEDITVWACRHHEKLDGSGYPFGLTAKDLTQPERLMACIDIYQALVEDRPYKEGMTHQTTMKILNNMVNDGQIDGGITADIDTVFG